MKSTDRVVFRDLLTRIGLLYGRTLHELEMNTWWQVSELLGFSEVCTALNQHIIHADKGRYRPLPADIVKALNGSPELRALEAWSDVAQAIRTVGAYSSVQFADPLIHAVIRDMGGWIALCQTKTADLPFRERDFEKRYQALFDHRPLDCPQQLTGLLEQQNRLWGILPPQVVLVGQVKSSTKLEMQHA